MWKMLLIKLISGTITFAHESCPIEVDGHKDRKFMTVSQLAENPLPVTAAASNQ